MQPAASNHSSNFQEGSLHHTGIKNAIDKILDICRVKSSEVPDHRNMIEDFVKILTDKMIEIDPLFAAMKPVFDIRGSSGNKLKVFKPDEFDVDVVLTPTPKAKVCVTVSQKYPSWAECFIDPTSFDWPIPKNKQRDTWKKLFNKKGQLSCSGLRSWTHSLVCLVKEAEEPKSIDWKSVKVTTSGPAVTINPWKEKKISIDLVAAVNIPASCNQFILNGLRYRHKVIVVLDEDEKQEVLQSGKICLSLGLLEKTVNGKRGVRLVPVEPRVAPEDPKPPDNLLRLSIPALDDELLKDRKTLKDAVRLLKVLRDYNQWNPIASFFLVSLGIGAHLHDDDLNDLSVTFLRLLFLLMKHLELKTLPLPWAPGCNLFVKLKPEFCVNVSGRIRSFFVGLKRLGIDVHDDGITVTSSPKRKDRVVADIERDVKSLFKIKERTPEKSCVRLGTV